MNFVLDADIRSCFDSINQAWLIRFLQHRINDPRIIRLIQKWLKAGILEDEIVTVGDTGTGQGSVASSLLSNVYLHYVFRPVGDVPGAQDSSPRLAVRTRSFIRFLNTMEEQVAAGKVIHATQKHQWLARHPRWTFHFTPTSASWLNAAEGFFAKLTRQRLKRGVFRSVVDLQIAINRFVADTNADPKPFDGPLT